MNFFEVYPQLTKVENPLLRDRSLRLIAISAIIYDDNAFYFEISPPEMWGHLPQGQFSIGIGTAKVRPDPYNVPSKALMLYLRKVWRCDVSPVAHKHTFILGDNQQSAVLDTSVSGTPYVLLLTPPQLGGGNEVPDALVQAVHLLKILRLRKKSRGVSMLKIQRSALWRFLEPVDWEIEHLMAQPWAEFLLSMSLPQHATVRPVLALRGLQYLLKSPTSMKLRPPQTLIPALEE